MDDATKCPVCGNNPCTCPKPETPAAAPAEGAAPAGETPATPAQ